MPDTDALVVLTTVANADEAVELVRALLDRRLIACGTLLSAARSLYRWKGRSPMSPRWSCCSRHARPASRADAAFDELHPYKVPEVLALPVVAGSDKYLGWIDKETSLALA